MRGSVTAEELAAVAAVVAAAAAATTEPPAAPPVRGRWNDPAYAHRRHWPVGVGGWRAAR